MPDRITPRADASLEDSDMWPWQCLDCGTTIYQDGEFCRVCAPSHRIGGGYSPPNSSTSFVGWMREQSLPSFVLKTTAVAGIELALTALWIQIALVRFMGPGTTLPI